MAKEFRIPFSRLRVDRFLFLLISILLFFVMRPFVEGFIGIRMLLDILFSVILFSGILAISQKNYHCGISLGVDTSASGDGGRAAAFIKSIEFFE